jgi:hypothetical protein
MTVRTAFVDLVSLGRFVFLFIVSSMAPNMENAVFIVCEWDAAVDEPTSACAADTTTPSRSVQEAFGRLNPTLLYKTELMPVGCQFDLVTVESQ